MKSDYLKARLFDWYEENADRFVYLGNGEWGLFSTATETHDVGPVKGLARAIRLCQCICSGPPETCEPKTRDYRGENEGGER